MPPTQRDELIAYLVKRGVGELPHARGRGLLDHLTETAAILGRWHQPDDVQRAALIHSVYGTDRYTRRLIEEDDRTELAEQAGPDAERLAHLFCTTPRGPLLAGTLRWSEPALTDADHDALVMLHMANLAEQAAAPDGSPSAWLVALRDMAVLLLDSATITLPDFLAALLTMSAEDERTAIDAYRAGDHALAAAANPVVPEPCLQLAATDEAWADLAGRRLAALGTTWDKRRTYEELRDAIASGARTPGASGRHAKRFLRYVNGLAGDRRRGGMYPDLPALPFHNPHDFPLAGYLEEHHAEIAKEILALDPAGFHREAEPIERTGDWDVAFFFERGRRHDGTCAACPVTTRAIELPGHRAMRTASGLIYASRLRAGTHIAAHRGPTNFRLRCHLGIDIPGGDCAIRVDGQTRRWQTGRCLVFDDHFEHEAWNHTDHDRLVLIVDVWHPDLDPEEIHLLEGLHGHIQSHAERLSRYWRTNEAAAHP